MSSDGAADHQYLALVQDILQNGLPRTHERTGVNTRAVFGRSMRFDLSNGRIPLLTTKRVNWHAIVHELLWFISGSTDANVLAAPPHNTHIWDANASRAFLDAHGFPESVRAQGDLGPIYGHQWRHAGAPYTHASTTTDYTGKGTDQLRQCIETIRSDPQSRRIIITSWNVPDLPLMALPPCHILCHFWVGNNRDLSCLVYQRSCDMGLGVPFNIASYGLLLHLIARACGLSAGELVYNMGDSHIYETHVEALSQQLKRQPTPPCPTVQLLKPAFFDIDTITADDIILQDYAPLPSISMPMAV